MNVLFEYIFMKPLNIIYEFQRTLVESNKKGHGLQF